MLPLHLRVASNSNDILYDLTHGGWNVIIRVTAQGWNIEKSPIIFRRYSSHLGQVLPSTKYEDNIFEQFMKLLNIEDNDSRLLLKCYITALFVPRIQKAILMLHGKCKDNATRAHKNISGSQQHTHLSIPYLCVRMTVSRPWSHRKHSNPRLLWILQPKRSE